MEYPKEVMSLPELKQLGFPKELLYRAAHAKNSGSFKAGGRTAKWYFRVQDFEVWLNKEAQLQK